MGNLVVTTPQMRCTVGRRFTTRSDSYQQHLSPPPIDGSSSRAVVNISVDIKTIQEIDEIESVFQVQFWLQMLWMDKRLTFST